MKDNQDIEVLTSTLRLSPYLPCHVPTYHLWMADEWLQDMTASERLTLEEEYEAQQAWIDDPQKCTFIVFERNQQSSSSLSSTHLGAGNQTAVISTKHLQTNNTTTTTTNKSSTEQQQSSGNMCGDVNIFLMDDDASEDYGKTEGSVDEDASLAASPPPPPSTPTVSTTTTTTTSSSSSSSSATIPKAAEVMVMIAEPSCRRKGYAQQAVSAIMQYAARELGIRRFVAKISEENQASLSLFQTKLGFRVSRRMPHFQEIHLAKDISGPDDPSLGEQIEIVARETSKAE